MKPLDYNVRDEFAHELNEIEYCLDGLRNRQVYELTKAKYYGTLANCADKIKKNIDAILNGIQTGKGGDKTLIGNWATKIEGEKNNEKQSK